MIMTTHAQATGKNRKMTVITSDLMMFTMEAEQWVYITSAEGSDHTWMRVYKAEPGKGTPSILIAEFPDIRAAYFDSDVQIVKPDD